MVDEQKILPGLKVHAKGVGAMRGIPGISIGLVDHIDGDYIRINRSDSSDRRQKWIPLDWVEKVDAKAVYLNKTDDEVIIGVLDEKPFDVRQAV